VDVTFRVAATGDGTLTYQWQRDGVDIAGATNETYTTPALTVDDDGALYRAVIGAPGSAALAHATSAPRSTAARCHSGRAVSVMCASSG
jgi:hypothetical protein